MKDTISLSLDIAIHDVRRLLRAGIDAGILNGLYAVEFIAPVQDKLYIGWEDVSEAERRILQHDNRKPVPQLDIDYPVSEGGAVIYSTMKGVEVNRATRWRLDLAAITDGLKLLADHSPDRFCDSLLGTPSASADIVAGVLLVQFSLFHKLPEELQWRY
jgi:hypothetical protein